MKGANRGFTIVEVVLFLAISMALFLIAFQFTSATVKVTQFTDVMKTFEAFIEQQYNRAQTGNVTSSITLDPNNKVVCKNDSNYLLSTTPVSGTVVKGYSNDCIVLGVFINLRYNAFTGVQDATSYPVLGYSGVTSNAGTDESMLAASQPVVWGQQPIDTYVFPAGFAPTAESQAWLNMIYSGNDTWYFEKIAFLKSPNTGTTRMYAYTDWDWNPAATTYGDPASKTLLGTKVNEENFFNDFSPIRNARAIICVTSTQSPNLQGVIKLEGNGGRGSFGIDNITSSLDKAGTVYWPSYLPTSTKYTGLRC